jgi:potassium efflux system protein
MRRTILMWIVLTVAILLSAKGTSQTNNNEVTDSTNVEEPVAIESTEIVEEAENERERLNIIQQSIQPKASVLEVDSLYKAQKVLVDDETRQARIFLKSNPNKQKVTNIIREWRGYSNQVDSWQGRVKSYVEDLDVHLKTLKFQEKVWDLTLKKAQEDDLPSEVIQSITTTRRDVLDLKQQIEKNYDDFLVQEAALNELKIEIKENIEVLDEFKRSEVYHFFYRRHPPLWSTKFFDKSDDNEGKGALSLDVSGQSIRDYFRKSDSLIDLFVLSIILLSLLMWYLRRSFLKYSFDEENGDLQRAKEVILKRAGPSLIFIIFINALFFFSGMPTLLNNILIFVAIIVAIPVVQPYLYKRFKSILFVIPVFYVLDHIKTYIWFTSSSYRIYLLFEAVMVMVVIYYYVHPYIQTRKMKIGYFGNAIIKSTPLLFILAIVSIVSNLLGFTNLTDITLKICTESAVLTVLFYAVMNLAAGIVTGILHAYFTNKSFFEPRYKLEVELKALMIVRYTVLLIWFIYFLGTIDQLKPISEWLMTWMNEQRTIGTTTFTYGAVFLFLTILTLSFIITSFISIVIEAGALKVLRLPKGVPAAISLVIRYLIIAFGFIIALSALGVNLSQFNLMAGALGLGIGFGLQNIVSNFISGLILVFERPILTGDTVEVNNLLGTVHRIGVRSSNIRTFDGAEVVVPNNSLITNDLINWTLSDNVKRLALSIGTAYGSDPNKVLEILTAEAEKCEYTLEDPKPRALFIEFGESSLNFVLHFWVPYEINLEAKSTVMIGIYNALKEAGIEIPFPQRDVHIKELPDKAEE